MMIGDLRDAQNELEDFYFSDQEKVLAEIEKMTAADRRAFLNRKSIDYADQMMKRWDKLAKFLIVRYNDQVKRRVDENGDLKPWGHDAIGYDKAFIDAIAPSTGDRYLLKKVIIRKER